MKKLFLSALLSLLATLAVLQAEPVPIDFVTVGDAGNVADSVTKLGAVAAPYQIGKYEVTVAQWSSFLNAVAFKADPHGLCNTNMTSDPKIACIEKTTNNDGTFTYTPLPNTDQLPITCVSYNNSLRFCNWYQNSMSTALQGHKALEASTEKGAYTFMKLADGTEQAVLSTNAIYTLATEDQWMKAAYYVGNGTNSGYWLYPTQHNSAPNIGAVDVFNEANWDTSSYASYWSGLEARKNRVLTPVDEFLQTTSAYQACDMGGNVNEWIMRSNEADPTSPLPITRGGSWASTYYAPNHWARTINDLMRTAPAQTYASGAAVLTEGNNQIGFRLVCSSVPPSPEELASALQVLESASNSSTGFVKIGQLQGISQGESWATIIGDGLEDAALVLVVAGVVYCAPFWLIDGAIGLSDEALTWLAEKFGIEGSTFEIRATLVRMRAQLGDFWNWALRPVKSAMTSVSDWWRGGGPLTRMRRGFWRFTG